MRRFILAAIIAAFAASPSTAATRNFGVSGFDRIRIEGPFKVTVRTGIAPFVQATGDTSGIDAVAVETQGRTLVIRRNRSAWGGYPGSRTGPVEIAVGTHDLTALWLNGAGDVHIDRVRGLEFDLSIQGAGSAAIADSQVDRMRATLFGAANARVAGAGANLVAIVRGAAGLDASSLAVKDADIGAEGTVAVQARVSNSAKIQAQGAATVTLTGRPACTIRSSGSASVSGCR